VTLPVLYILRHGETANNVERRISGQRDTPLTERGRQQAAANGALLASLVPDFSAVDFVASPLGRARETMRLVRSAAGLDPEGFLTDERLMEANFGDWTGLLVEKMFHQRAQDGRYERDPWNFRMPNGESRADVHARVLSFLGGLRRNTVIVAHAGSVVMLRGIRLGLSRDEIMKLEARNAGIVVVTAGGEQAHGT
jgi:broad specificity phosphatase PhoE